MVATLHFCEPLRVWSAPVEIVFITPEVAPYSRESHVGDVAGALPKALRGLGHQVSVISPRYGMIDPGAHSLAKRLSTVDLELADAEPVKFELYDGRTTGGVDVTFLGHADLISERPMPDSAEPRMLTLFARAAVEHLAARSGQTEVLQGYGLLGALALLLGEQVLPEARRILALQGQEQELVLDAELVAGLGLPEAVQQALSAHSGKLLSAAIASAHRVVLGSRRFLAGLTESAEQPPSDGLGSTLAQSLDKLTGIGDGLDASIWNPLIDPHIGSRFDPVDLAGKERCKGKAQHDLGLPVRPDVPLLVAVPDTNGNPAGAPLGVIAAELLQNDLQLIVVCEDNGARPMLSELADEFDDRLRMVTAAGPEQRHRLIAAADILLIGPEADDNDDTHLCAQRYGALPVVGGGAADTVVDCDAKLQTGSGFVYGEQTEAAFLAAARRSVAAYSQRDAFEALRRRVMRLDTSWERSARSYEYAYRG